MLPYQKNLKPYARQLRSRTTDAEQKLWRGLRGKQLGVQFYRQKPLGTCIVDFYCAAAKLVVELDGGQHFDDVGLRRDHARDGALGAMGLKILRFDNRQAMTETDAVLEAIRQRVVERTGNSKSP